jgi:hypothetical protein
MDDLGHQLEPRRDRRDLVSLDPLGRVGAAGNAGADIAWTMTD